MTPLTSRSALSALSAHRFLMRAAFAATLSFAWVFALQYLYGLFGNITDAFIRVILLYELAQVVTILLTPYAARQLMHGLRGRMVAGILTAVLALIFFGAALSDIFQPIFGLVSFAIFMGIYRAFYWTPYVLEKEHDRQKAHIPQEIFIAFMPAIVGYALLNGHLGAAILLFAGASILIASIAPLFQLPEIHERYMWGYGETFAELFEPKYNPIVESSFLAGLQGTALLLLWPLSVFIIVGLSYQLLGLVLSATLLLAILLRPRGRKLLEGRDLLHATIAASSWVLRLAVVSPLTVVFVGAYASPTDASADFVALEQSADNGTYLDEYTALKEIALCLGRVAMCIVAAVSIGFFSLPVGLGVAFALAAAASVIGILHNRQSDQF